MTAAMRKGFDSVPSNLVIGKEIDRGSFGVVYLATLDKKSVAAKRFHKALMNSVGPGENVPLKNFKTECERLKDLNHPNVVRYIGAYEDYKGPLLVMELMYDSLEKYLKRNKGRLSPERVLELCSSVCEGMAYLHGRVRPLVHRDLGSKNVLLTKEGVVKIADFGQSKLLQNHTDSLKTTQPGTIAYMPPEALKEGGECTAKVDSFSLGVLMLEICTQSAPSSGWDGINRDIEVKRRKKDLSLLDDAHPLKPLVVWCLQHEKLRPAVAVIHHHVKNVCETNKVKITGGFRTSTEEKGKLEKEIKTLQDQCEALQVQLEFNRVDFEQERSDRATAAGRYADLEEQLKKVIEKTGEELGRMTEEVKAMGIDRDRLKRELQLKQVPVTKKKSSQLTNLREQLEQATASSQGLEIKLQKQETEYHQLEQQLRREINDLKDQNANLTQEIARRDQMRPITGSYWSWNEGRYQGQLGKEGEDVDLLVATLRSENSYLKEENKRLQSNFDRALKGKRK